MTKKEYKKPTITKREKLGKVTAGAVASVLVEEKVAISEDD